jgi:hypothetical protein
VPRRHNRLDRNGLREAPTFLRDVEIVRTVWNVQVQGIVHAARCGWRRPRETNGSPLEAAASFMLTARREAN